MWETSVGSGDGNKPTISDHAIIIGWKPVKVSWDQLINSIINGVI